MKNEITIKGIKIKVEDFKQVCIDLYTVSEIAQHYKCGTTTISNKIKEAFPELPRYNRTPIGYKLLELENKMKCYVCKNIYPYESYYVSTYTKNGLSKECKNCSEKRNKSDKKKIADKQYRESEEGQALRKANEAKRRASKLQRTPKWANLGAIRDIYKNCPEGYHVDHIIPLQGEYVSGLHVENNLQYLSAHENLSKSNKFNPQ